MKKTVDDLVKSANRLLDTVKHAVILLQMARSHLEGASLLGLNADDEESENSQVNILLSGLHNLFFSPRGSRKGFFLHAVI